MECRLCFQLWKFFRKTALNVHWKKLIYNREEKPEQKYDVTFGTVLRICNWHLIFVSLFNYAEYLNHLHLQKVQIYFICHQKYPSDDLIPLSI
jgi:hypothetical protein